MCCVHVLATRTHKDKLVLWHARRDLREVDRFGKRHMGACGKPDGAQPPAARANEPS